MFSCPWVCRRETCLLASCSIGRETPTMIFCLLAWPVPSKIWFPIWVVLWLDGWWAVPQILSPSFYVVSFHKSHEASCCHRIETATSMSALSMLVFISPFAVLRWRAPINTGWVATEMTNRLFIIGCVLSVYVETMEVHELLQHHELNRMIWERHTLLPDLHSPRDSACPFSFFSKSKTRNEKFPR